MTLLWNPHLEADALKWRDLAVRLTTDHFAPAAAEIDQQQRYPTEHVTVLQQSGIGAMFIPQQYGGSGASLTAVVAVMEAIAAGCASTSAILAALQLGAFPILSGGNDQQKQELLGGLARDGKAVCFALSERNAGSDVSAMQTKAVREPSGWRIWGEKAWLGNGGHSQFYIVFAKCEPDNAISAFIVPRDAQGVTVDHYEDKLGIRGTTTTNLKLDVRVPEGSLVGPLGRGLRLAFQTLKVGRVVIAAQALGIAVAAFEEASLFASRRRAFGQVILDHQGVGFKLADALTELTAARVMLYEVSRAYDAGEDISTMSSMVKLFASEVSHRIVDSAMQTLGGRGYVKPSPMERYYRDQRITEIYEGTSEIQRVVLVRAIKESLASEKAH